MTTLTLSTILLAFAPQSPIEKPEVHKGALLVEAAKIYVSKDRVLDNSAIVMLCMAST